MSDADNGQHPAAPPFAWRATSTATIAAAGIVSRGFLKLFNRTETHGLEGFLKLLDEREDVHGRKRGLITVSNHVSVVDDPLIWGVLPIRYLLNPDNMRWSLGSYDICFQNRFSSAFFTYGQVLPTHRLAHSPYGGLFQPTIAQAIRLLSKAPFSTPSSSSTTSTTPPPPSISDPFSSPTYTYTTNSLDTFPSPTAYASRTHAWLHIFPEGKIHQSPQHHMRYFKWGVARLILESEPAPDIVPMWIDGPQEIMNEERTFPRPVPRIGKRVTVAFGNVLRGEDADAAEMEAQRDTSGQSKEEGWTAYILRRLRSPGPQPSSPSPQSPPENWVADARHRWRLLLARSSPTPLGTLPPTLQNSPEAIALRKEVTLRVREEVLAVRRSLGYPDEDPKAGMVETYMLEGGRREGKMGDGSVVRDM